MKKKKRAEFGWDFGWRGVCSLAFSLQTLLTCLVENLCPLFFSRPVMVRIWFHVVEEFILLLEVKQFSSTTAVQCTLTPQTFLLAIFPHLLFIYCYASLGQHTSDSNWIWRLKIRIFTCHMLYDFICWLSPPAAPDRNRLVSSLKSYS